MTDVETVLAADEVGLRGLASWMRGPLANALELSTNALIFARQDRGVWSGPSADAFRSRMSSVLSWSDSGSASTSRAAATLEQFADAIVSLRARIASLRERAASAGLELTSTSIVRPSLPLALPAVPVAPATTAALDTFHAAIAAHDLAIELQAAFSDAHTSMSAVRTDLNALVTDLDRVVADVRALLIPALDFVTGSGLGVAFDKGVVAMRGNAAFLAESAARAQAATVRPGAALAPELFYDDLDRAAQLAVRSQAAIDDAARLVRVGKASGWVVGGALTGVSIYQDIQAGESTTQAVVSNGGGFLASVGAGAAIGGMIGTVVPGPGMLSASWSARSSAGPSAS